MRMKRETKASSRGRAARWACALVLTLGAAGTARAQSAQDQLRTILGSSGADSAAPPEVRGVLPEAVLEQGGACRVETFEMTLEGWNRDRRLSVREPCSLKPVDPQPTCLQGPCFNIGCRALIHYHAVFELPPGQSRQWPSCNFSQQRMGLRSHHDQGRRKLDQYEPGPSMDFNGSVEGWGKGYSLHPVAGRPNLYELDFYDMPGWAVTYPLGRPNAVAPIWFPIDWHYMYRAYFGPKRAGLTDADYRYASVDMEASASPSPSFALDQGPRSPQDWTAFQQGLRRLPPQP